MSNAPKHHNFLFSYGTWIGEGRISFTASPEVLSFFTRWTSKPGDREGDVRCVQRVEMSGVDDQVINQFRFFDIREDGFAVELQNELVGIVRGKGIISEKEIAWEFRGHPSFEGFEVYRCKDNGDWTVHAEFASPDQFRTVIEGRIWEKVAQD